MMENDPKLSELSRSLNENYIYYDPTREDYAISKKELEILENAGSSIWQNVFWATLGLSIPTLLNGVIGLDQYTKNTSFPIYTFLSLVVGVVTLLMAVISLILWLTTKSIFKSQMDEIKRKPKFKVPTREDDKQTEK